MFGKYLRIVHKNGDRVIQDIREMEYSIKADGCLNRSCSSQLMHMLEMADKNDVIEVRLVD